MPEIVLSITDFMVTSLEVWGLIFLMQNEKKRHGKFGIFMYGLFLVGMISFMTKTGVSLIPKFICIVFLVTILGRIVYCCDVLKLLFYALILILTSYSSEMIVIQFWNIFNEPVFSNNIIYEEFTLSLIIVSKALYLFSIFIIENVIKGFNKRRGSREIVLVFIAGVPFLLLLEIINISLALIKDKSMNVIFLLGSVVIFVAFIIDILLTRYYWEVMEREQREKKSVYELQLKCDYYLKRMQDEEHVKCIYHDLKNHLLFSENDFWKEQNLKKLQLYEKYYNTGNDFLDIILADKIELAWKKGIQMECNVNLKEGYFIEPFDISTIFGNFLDNAIEATEKLCEEEKIIYFKVENRGGLIIAVIKNYIDGNKSLSEEQLLTSKGNKQYHGYGISNAKKEIYKYNGECSINIRNNEFIVSIVIPIPKDER